MPEEETDLLEELAKALTAHMEPHLKHPWHQRGRCVYCGPCKLKLYQGEVPKGHAVFRPGPGSRLTRKMRELWGR